MDKHYTPRPLAEQIVGKLHHISPSCVADFAAGNGALLRAIQDRWPEARLVATDIDSAAVKRLRKSFAKIDAEQCDFLDLIARDNCKLLKRSKGKISLAFINPPFSCRGGKRYSASFCGSSVTCSKAMAFLISALEYLRLEGQLVAILPASCLTSEKDAAAMGLLSRYFEIQEIETGDPYRFRNCRVRISCVWFRHRSDEKLTLIPSPTNPLPGCQLPCAIRIELIRGRISMHNFASERGRSKLPLVHTTEMQESTIHLSGRRVRTDRSIVRGPVILLPRVGRPYKAKLCFVGSEKPVAISDCIVAIRAESCADTLSLYNAMGLQWSVIASQYLGSCAPYITMNRLGHVLQQICADTLKAAITFRTFNSRLPKFTAGPRLAFAA